MEDHAFIYQQRFLVPIGGVVIYTGIPVPLGFLECDGRAVSRTVFRALFSVIGTSYGPGDGSTTFNLPDMSVA